MPNGTIPIWNSMFGRRAITTRPTCYHTRRKDLHLLDLPENKDRRDPCDRTPACTEVPQCKSYLQRGLHRGYLTSKDCPGEKLSGEPTARKKHTTGMKKSATEATCKNTGVRRILYNNCGETKIKVIPMTDHITQDNGR